MVTLETFTLKNALWNKAIFETMRDSNEVAGFFPEGVLQAMRQQADPPADEVVERLMQSGQREALHHWWQSIRTNAASVPDHLPQEIKYYLLQTQNLPAWADKRRIQRGQRFFAQHARPILSILGCLSLPYCYAAADGAQVLWLSQRIRHDTRQRLTETAQFLLDVLSPQAFMPQGKGIRSIQQVRLIHAVARYYAQRSPQWNQDWGVPVNQEDMAGTNLAFSYIVLQGLQKLGFQWSVNEAEDFLHTWNVIGALLGVDQLLLPQNLQEAYWLDKTIARRHFRRSEPGVGLTRALLNCLHEINDKSAVGQAFTYAYMRFLLGDKVADLLEIPVAQGAPVFVPAFKSVNLLSTLVSGFSSTDPKRVSSALQQELQREAVTHFRLPLAFG